MKTVIIIETAEELVKFANPSRGEGDTMPFIQKGKLVFENSMDRVRLEATGFEMEDVTPEAVLTVLAKHCHLDIHIT